MVRMNALYKGRAVRQVLLGLKVERATDTLPASTDEALFTISGGRVAILALIGEVTVVIQTQADATKLKFNPDATGADQDLCATLDITADPVGEMYTISGTVGDAMRSDLLIADAILAKALVLSEGAIEIDCAATNTGSVAWTLLYVPVDDGAQIVATAV